MSVTPKRGASAHPKTTAYPPNHRTDTVTEPPHALPLEQAVLGAVMLDKSAFPLLLRILQKPHFYALAHQQLFDACHQLYQRNEPIDMLTVAEECRRMGYFSMGVIQQQLETKLAEKNNLSRAEWKQLKHVRNAQIKGPAYLVELTNRVASAANIEYHARIIYQKFMRRDLMRICEEAMQRAFDNQFDILDTYTGVQQNLRFTTPTKMLKIQTMNDAVAEGEKEGVARKLCGSLLTESDVCFFYSEPGIGKTAVVVQIGDAIARGKSFIDTSEFQNECGPKDVLLIDFELQNSELFSRYSGESKGIIEKYQFADNFKRASIKADFIDFDQAEHFIMLEVETLILQEQPELIIIDNITYLTSEASDNKMATKFMKKIISLQRKSENKMSIIVIAHTKKRDRSQPIEKEDMKGASEISAFAKNMVGIGYSKKDNKLRYMKQTKVRNNICELDADHVALFEIDKPDLRLKYIFQQFTTEVEHLVSPELDEGLLEQALYDAVQCHLNGTSYNKTKEFVNKKYGLSWSKSTTMRKVKAELERRRQRRQFADEPTTEQPSVEEIREFNLLVAKGLPAEEKD